MTNGKRNRSAGNGWERELAQIFRDLGFPYVVTTRSESRTRDAQKIDLINKDEFKNGRLPYNVQAKNVKGHLPYARILAELPHNLGIVNVIMHKQTERVQRKFVTRDKFAILKLTDFLTMIKRLNDYESTTTRREVVQPTERRTDKAIHDRTKRNT